MNKEDLNKIIELRKSMIDHYQKLKDYRSNKNALIKEIDHAAYVHKIIVQIDQILKPHVSFE
jgi:hypothetical protein